MHLDYSLDDLYLVACSGGPDSMALLDMLIKENYNVIVAHVNYKTRDESDSEEQLVKDYCALHNVKCYVSYFDHNYKGSFEDAARKFRYAFFADIYKKEECNALFVAHHKDDVLETYLLKKQRNVVNESYLIKPITYINNMKVIRPLVFEYYKEDLLNYCNLNNISYGIDKTNFMDIHPRNVIRKQMVKMDKDKLYEEALKEEEKLIETRKNVKEYIKYYPIYLSSFLKEQEDLWLSIFLYEKCDKKFKKHINKSILLKLKDFVNSDKPNLIYNICDDYFLEKKYNQINFIYKKENDFCYVLDKLEYINTPYFKLKNSGLKMEGIYVSEQDFPITIRNCKSDDKIKLKEGSKRINRLFIDKKVPMSERKMIPIIENKDKEIIFVYKLYRKYGLKYVKNNLFMIK